MSRRIALDSLATRYGGSAYAVVQLARALRDRDDVSRVLVIAGLESIPARGLVDEPGIELVSVALPPRATLAARAAWSAVKLPSLLRHWRADLLLAGAGMLPRMPHCRVVLILWNPVPFESRRALDRVRRAAIRSTARRGGEPVVPTLAMAELTAPFLGRRPRVVPLGVDRELFRPAPVPGNELLFVSDFYAHKRHDLALAAWQLLPEPRPILRLIGNPAVDLGTYALVRTAVRQLGDPRVVLEGSVPRARLLDAYRRARLFLMPSEHESFSMSLAEAMCSGVPAVARRTAVLEETAGLGAEFVDSDDPRDWARAIEKLWRDSIVYRVRREAAIRHGERFSWTGMAAVILQDQELSGEPP